MKFSYSVSTSNGKLIGIEDTLALIIEDKTNREIRFGVVSVTKMIFLPI